VERRADPSNKVLLKERGDLFKQVGLPEVADHDYAAAQRHQPEPHLNDQFSFDETQRFIVAWPDFCLDWPSALASDRRTPALNQTQTGGNMRPVF